MTYNNNVPFAKAEYLQYSGEEEKCDYDGVPSSSSVMQARVTEETSHHHHPNDQGAITTVVVENNPNDPTIHVPARNVMTVESIPQQQDNDVYASSGYDLHHKIADLKKKRKRNQKIAIVAGFVGGCIICGPILGIVGAVATHYTVKRLGRAKQARLQAELDRDTAIAIIVGTSSSQSMKK